MTGVQATGGLEPVGGKTISLVDRIAHELRAAIVHGRLRPGERLPIAQLAKTLHTSQVPVREALQRLAGDGLVVLQASRSATVAPMSLQDLREIYRIRLLNEVDAVTRAAPALGHAELGDMAFHLDEFSSAPAESERFWTHHDAFHRTLMQPVMTPRLEHLIDEVWRAIERYTRLVYVHTDVLRATSVLDRHLPLLEAARTRSGQVIADALTEHLISNEAEMEVQVAALFPDD